ncbi:MAG: insulinase family protein [Bacteroidales bacterium]|nr:insulinase family protein [Bacteroidales bacterium]
MISKPVVFSSFLKILNLIVVAVLFSTCGRAPSYSGYQLIEKRFVNEVNAACFLLEHRKSGARILKVAADDPNKTFSIAFRTIPETDAGIPHIMEHCVLNGSKNFPVKSPFDVLSKGSLNTFLNAMTYTDFTVYPVASMNKTDYFNLMHVYLDAVFNPLIYDDPRIFMQEGWHYELTSVDDPLVYKGVVYNEMKGAFSSPTRELWYQIQKNLFPENAYGNSSGGYPPAIPTLTYDEFVNYHKKYYHPSNSYIFLYGDADLAEELAFIDREYLSHYEKSDDVTAIPLHSAFTELKEAAAYYPVIEGAPVNDQTYLAISWVIGNGNDQKLIMALEALADVLVNQESAPVRMALQEAGIGKDVSAYADHLQQNIFTVIVQNANLQDQERFRSVIMETLRKVVADGLDQEALEGSLNRMEFRLREGEDANKGVNYSTRTITGWLYANDPIGSLEYEKPLYAIKNSLKERYLENIIEDDLLDNTYGLILRVEPKPGLENENMARTAGHLEELKAGLPDEELESIVTTTRELIAYQQQEDSPEALASVPLLTLSDIDEKAPWYEAKSFEISGIPQLAYHEFTNDIVYVNLWFDLRVLSQDMLQYAALLAELLGKLDTEKYTYGQLEKLLNTNTGGFNSSLNVFFPGYDDNNMIPKFQVAMKTTGEKLNKGLEILEEIVNGTKYDNVARLRELLARHQSQLEMYMMQNGYNVALMRFISYLSQRGMFSELSGGVSYYWFITDLLKKFDSGPDAVVEKLQAVSGLLFTRSNMMAGTTCNESDFNMYAPAFESFFSAFTDKPVRLNHWKLDPIAGNEGFLTASKVQYVIKGYDYRKLGLDWNGKWNVLNQILSTGWLQTQIRVIGGAYGGFSGFNRNGTIYFASYRDPNLKETLDNFDETVDYLREFQADLTDMTRFIIGTIARMDRPLTPEAKGNLAFRRYLEGVRQEEIQNDRNAILSASSEDIRNMTDAVTKILDQDVWCVYGNEEKLKENRTLFRELLTIQK